MPVPQRQAEKAQEIIRQRWPLLWLHIFSTSQKNLSVNACIVICYNVFYLLEYCTAWWFFCKRIHFLRRRIKGIGIVVLKRITVYANFFSGKNSNLRTFLRDENIVSYNDFPMIIKISAATAYVRVNRYRFSRGAETLVTAVVKAVVFIGHCFSDTRYEKLEPQSGGTFSAKYGYLLIERSRSTYDTAYYFTHKTSII